MTYVTNPKTAGRASPLAMDVRRTHHLKQNEPSAHPIRCLVVDDDHTILKYVAHMLAMLGFQEVGIAQRQPDVMEKLIAGPHSVGGRVAFQAFWIEATGLHAFVVEGWYLSPDTLDTQAHHSLAIMRSKTAGSLNPA